MLGTCRHSGYRLLAMRNQNHSDYYRVEYGWLHCDLTMRQPESLCHAFLVSTLLERFGEPHVGESPYDSQIFSIVRETQLT